MNSTETSGITRTEGPPVNRGGAVASATAISRKHRSTGIVIWKLAGRLTLEASYPLARHNLALGGDADTNQNVAVHPVALTPCVKRPAAFKRNVKLLLIVRSMVVFRIVIPVWRHPSSV